MKGGFLFKLGEFINPNQISFNDKEIIDKKLSKAKSDANQKLLARLEKLENITLKFQSSSYMISVATKGHFLVKK